MSTLQKLFISPASSTSCRSCGKGVTLRWPHYLAVILPAAVALFGINRFFPEPKWLLLTGAALAMLVCSAQLLLPLVKERF